MGQRLTTRSHRRMFREVGAIIRRARERAGVTQELLGDHAGVTRQAIANIEAGRGISLRSLADIAWALGLPMSRLVP